MLMHTKLNKEITLKIFSYAFLLFLFINRFVPPIINKNFLLFMEISMQIQKRCDYMVFEKRGRSYWPSYPTKY